MPTAFLSHSSLDKEIVGRVFSELGAAGSQYDSATFDVGERSSAEIYSALNRSDLFVLLVSQASVVFVLMIDRIISLPSLYLGLHT